MTALGMTQPDPAVAIIEDTPASCSAPAADPLEMAGVALPKPVTAGWTIKVVGVDCNNGPWSCTKPSGHIGRHGGVCVPGKTCSTIYPHNKKEKHAWLTVRVSGQGGMVQFPAAEIPILLGVSIGATSLAAPDAALVNALPGEYKTVLMEVCNFVFGDASPMSRLWLSCVATKNGVNGSGPRSLIARCLNERLTDNDPERALDLLQRFAFECNNIPWPFPGFAT